MYLSNMIDLVSNNNNTNFMLRNPGNGKCDDF